VLPELPDVMWNMRQKVGKKDLAFLLFLWLLWRQLSSPTIKLMTNYMVPLLYLMRLINGKHYESNKYLYCLSYPGAISQIGLSPLELEGMRR